jgi:flagellar motor switch protein FliN/FliY
MIEGSQKPVLRAQDAAPEEELEPIAPAGARLSISDIKKVKLNVFADLGNCKMLVREVLELRRGSVLTLNKLAGEMADLYVNGVPFAKGEIVVLGDNLHVRIAEIFGAGEQESGQ